VTSGRACTACGPTGCVHIATCGDGEVSADARCREDCELPLDPGECGAGQECADCRCACEISICTEHAQRTARAIPDTVECNVRCERDGSCAFDMVSCGDGIVSRSPGCYEECDRGAAGDACPTAYECNVNCLCNPKWPPCSVPGLSTGDCMACCEINVSNMTEYEECIAGYC
jgi:hypothetical protein